MNEKWKQIWTGKEVPNINDDISEYETFCILKKADGFDVAVKDEEKYFKGFYNEFLVFFEKARELCGGNINSVYEVGCGSGVNLFMFGQREKNIKIGGLDYSENLLKTAKEITGGDFLNIDAALLPTEPTYDMVMSEGVFEYFDSPEYASEVIRRMIEKSGKLTSVLGVYDADKEYEMMNHRRKTIPNYDEVYRDLQKQFYKKEWFEKIAAKFNKKVLFTECNNEEYWNAKYQYNVYIL